MSHQSYPKTCHLKAHFKPHGYKMRNIPCRNHKPFSCYQVVPTRYIQFPVFSSFLARLCFTRHRSCQSWIDSLSLTWRIRCFDAGFTSPRPVAFFKGSRSARSAMEKVKIKGIVYGASKSVRPHEQCFGKAMSPEGPRV